jgi:hypothetical protein
VELNNGTCVRRPGGRQKRVFWMLRHFGSISGEDGLGIVSGGRKVTFIKSSLHGGEWR